MDNNGILELDLPTSSEDEDDVALSMERKKSWLVPAKTPLRMIKRRQQQQQQQQQQQR